MINLIDMLRGKPRPKEDHPFTYPQYVYDEIKIGPLDDISWMMPNLRDWKRVDQYTPREFAAKREFIRRMFASGKKSGDRSEVLCMENKTIGEMAEELGMRIDD
jgi:hypothetical protein